MNLNFYGRDNREQSSLDVGYGISHGLARNFFDVPSNEARTANVVCVISKRVGGPVSFPVREFATSRQYEFRIFSLGMKSDYGEAPWRPKNNKDDTMS